MSKNKLDIWLASCPRDRAGAGFTRQVMERITRSDANRRSGVSTWTRLALATTVAAVALLAFGLWQAGRQRQTARDELLLEELRAEHAAITHELKELKSDPSQLPVVYLGGTERVNLVLDLERLQRGRAQTVALPATPSMN